MESSVIVLMDANRNRGNLDALDWALNRVVRPKDNVIAIGIICEFGKRTSCFPFDMGIGISAIWERLEFNGQGEMTPKVVEEEIAQKRKQYQLILQPYYRQCKKNEVKLEVKLAAGFDPEKIAIEEAQKSNTRWIVLDSHLRKHKDFIHNTTGFNVAAMKEKDVATISMSKVTDFGASIKTNTNDAESTNSSSRHEEKKTKPSASPLPTTCWSPLSWQNGFPREFTLSEIENITSGFANENMVAEEENLKLYRGVLIESPVLVKCFCCNAERFWAELQILSRVRHRNISNLVGYCCTDSSMFLLQDYSYEGSLDMHLQDDELAGNLTWEARLSIAQGIGSCLRYLQENCIDANMSFHLRSSDILISHGHPVMLTELACIKCQKDWKACAGDLFGEKVMECQTEANQHFSLDMHAYGLFILELLTGRRASVFDESGERHTLEDWALPLIKTCSLHEVIDPRLSDSSDAKEIQHMACAASLCLRGDSVNQPSIGEVLAMIRGDKSRPTL